MLTLMMSEGGVTSWSWTTPISREPPDFCSAGLCTRSLRGGRDQFCSHRGRAGDLWGDCSRFDPIGLHVGAGAAVRTDSARSVVDAQGAVRLSLSHQHDLVAEPFGQDEPPASSRGTLRVAAGGSAGPVDVDGSVGVVLVRADAGNRAFMPSS